MFNWLISSKKNKNSSDDIQEELDFLIPDPPEADWDLAVRIKKQNGSINHML